MLTVPVSILLMVAYPEGQHSPTRSSQGQPGRAPRSGLTQGGDCCITVHGELEMSFACRLQGRNKKEVRGEEPTPIISCVIKLSLGQGALGQFCLL